MVKKGYLLWKSLLELLITLCNLDCGKLKSDLIFQKKRHNKDCANSRIYIFLR